MEDKLYDAIARVLFVGIVDEYGNKLSNPLEKAIKDHLSRPETTQKLEKLVSKKIDLDDFADAVVKKLKESGSTWYPNTESQKLKDLVFEKVAEKLAAEKIEEMKMVESSLSPKND